MRNPPRDESPLRVDVGLVIQVTREEARTLEEVSGIMYNMVHRRRIGWLAEYVKAHAHAGRIIRQAVTRSHEPS